MVVAYDGTDHMQDYHNTSWKSNFQVVRIPFIECNHLISLRIIRILSIFNYCVSITKHSNLSNVILMPHSRSLCFIPADAMCPVPFIILQEAYNDLLYPKYVFISFIFQWNWIPGSWGLFLIPFWFDVRPPLIQCYNQWTWFPGPWFHFAQDIYKDVSDS